MSKERVPPLLIVLSGPSGVGKDTVIRELKRRWPELHYLVTATTRAPRPGEVDGVNYHFLSREEFVDWVRNGEFLEWANVHGNLYGSPLADIRAALAEGKDVMLKIDVQGAKQVKQKVPEALFIFLVPPSMEVLLERLKERQSESEEDLALRTRNAHLEMEEQYYYDYVVQNDTGQVERTVERLKEIILAEKNRHPPRLIEL